MNLQELKVLLMGDLDRYEASMRVYLDKVDEDRPWVGSAMWQHTWNFRLDLINLIEEFEKNLQRDRYLKDPG